MKYIISKPLLRAAAIAALIATSSAANAWDFVAGNGDTFANSTASWTAVQRTVNTNNGTVSFAAPALGTGAGTYNFTGGVAQIFDAATSGVNARRTAIVTQLSSLNTDMLSTYRWYDIDLFWRGAGTASIVAAADFNSAVTAALTAGSTLAINAPTANNPALTSFASGVNKAQWSINTATNATFTHNTFYFAPQADLIGDKLSGNNIYLVLLANDNAGILQVDNASVVPEPEGYAMLLAGLGAIGFMSRRRKYRA